MLNRKINKKIEQLRSVTAVQCTKGNWDYCEYMRGMANGLKVAMSIFDGEDPVFFDSLGDESVASAMRTVSEAIQDQEDDGYAIGWQANVAMLLYDYGQAEHPEAQAHGEANRMAGAFIGRTFGRNTANLFAGTASKEVEDVQRSTESSSKD